MPFYGTVTFGTIGRGKTSLTLSVDSISHYLPDAINVRDSGLALEIKCVI